MLMEKLAGEAILKMDQFNPQDLSNLTRALATLGGEDEAPMVKLAGQQSARWSSSSKISATSLGLLLSLV